MRFTVSALSFALFAVPAAAQTTGVAGFNGYHVSSFAPPRTPAGYEVSSCATLSIELPLEVGLWFGASITPSALTHKVYFLISPLPCVPNSAAIAACSGTTTDLALSPAPVIINERWAWLGFASVAVSSFPPLPSGFTFSSQALVFDPNCGGLPLFTPAWNITVL